MKSKQQNEALHYFKKHAQEWNRKVMNKDHRTVNIIQQRNCFVLQVIKNRARTQNALDVGCGTGDLVCDIARMGIEATGVDFVEEMIVIARSKAIKDHLVNAEFHYCSIYDFDVRGIKYDCISANGFIEYISLDELNKLFDLSHQLLNPGGSLIVGSRNRLFNVFSINNFSICEINQGTVLLLLKEAITLAAGVSFYEIGKMDIAPLQDIDANQIDTGINVSTRYQFTPAQLIKILTAKGFSIEQIYPIHIHGVPPVFTAKNPEVHYNISNLLQNYASEHRSLIPFASSFMLHAQKE